MRYFVYLTTNLINKKQYVGDHSSNKDTDNYFGSGLLINNAIKKYGKENFKKQVLEEFETKKEAFNAQEKYINEYNTLAPNGYNISPKGGHQTTNSVSEDTRKKMRKSAKNRPPQTEETKIKRRKSLKGHAVSIETKNKIQKKQKGISKKEIFIRKYGNDEGIKKYNDYVKKMSLTKLNMTQETKDKIKVSTKAAMQKPEVKEKLHFVGKRKIPWNKK